MRDAYVLDLRGKSKEKVSEDKIDKKMANPTNEQDMQGKSKPSLAPRAQKAADSRRSHETTKSMSALEMQSMLMKGYED